MMTTPTHFIAPGGQVRPSSGARYGRPMTETITVEEHLPATTLGAPAV